MSLRTFATEAVTAFHTTAAIAPSSRYLTEAMLEPLPLRNARTVVELGPGTGVMTRALLQVLPQNAALFAFEINPQFVHYLRETIPDPRLRLFNASAETVAQALRYHNCQQIDAVVSSLGLGFLSEPQRQAVIGGLLPFMHQQSVLTQFQYIHSMQMKDGRPSRFSAAGFLHGYFQSVERKMVLRNLPPAFVLICRR
jgi:phosphatidylethanolamine/phosphatidyl-N-methylethanolamine N-methyltransferase